MRGGWRVRTGRAAEQFRETAARTLGQGYRRATVPQPSASGLHTPRHLWMARMGGRRQPDSGGYARVGDTVIRDPPSLLSLLAGAPVVRELTNILYAPVMGNPRPRMRPCPPRPHHASPHTGAPAETRRATATQGDSLCAFHWTAPDARAYFTCSSRSPTANAPMPMPMPMPYPGPTRGCVPRCG